MSDFNAEPDVGLQRWPGVSEEALTFDLDAAALAPRSPLLRCRPGTSAWQLLLVMGRLPTEAEVALGEVKSVCAFGS